jgi:UDP-N-acetylmuramate--alanine ligase
MDDFAHAFQAADRVYVLDIYPASEKPIPGVTSQRLVERMAEVGFDRAQYAPSEQAVIRGLMQDLRPGDLILTVGAGNVWRVGDALAEAIQGHSSRTGAVQS